MQITQALISKLKELVAFKTHILATLVQNRKSVILKPGLLIKQLTLKHLASKNKIQEKITSNWVQSTLFSKSKVARAQEYHIMITLMTRTIMTLGSNSSSIREMVRHHPRRLLNRMCIHRGRRSCCRRSRLIRRIFWLIIGPLIILSK